MIRKRGKSYGVLVYDPTLGRKRQVGSRPTLKEARALERTKAEEFTRRFRSAETIADYAERWLEFHPRPEATTNGHNRSQIAVLTADMGERRLDELGPREAREWALGHRAATKVAAAMYADAVRDEVVGHNPFAKLNLPKPRGRQDITPLSEEEVYELADAAEEVHGPVYGATFRAVVLFAAYVGLRPAELFALTWDDIDLKKNEVRIERQLRRDGVHAPKTKKARTVVLPPPAREAILSMPRTLGLLFTNPSGGQLTRSSHRYHWDRVRLAAGRPRLDFYELRHFCGSHLADKGLGIRDVAHQLGNTVEVCERYYVHTYEDRARDRLRRAFEEPVPLELARERKEQAS